MYKVSKKASKRISKKFSKKTKKQTQQQTQQQTGAGIFKIHPKKYNNLKYSKSGYVTPALTCTQCKNDVFRHHKATHGSKLRAVVLNSDVLDKKYNIFVCYKCGFMMNYSGDITYDSTT
jgi:hypothetical protein